MEKDYNADKLFSEEGESDETMTNKKQKILITGGAGFIGHHFVEHFLKNTNWDIYVVDNLTYASGGLSRIKDIEAYNVDRVKIFTADFTKPLDQQGLIDEIGQLDYIVHMGAETHVDNSIKDPRKFVYANVVGTLEVLEFARLYQPNLKRFIYFSTDEVFGPAPEGVSYKEWDRYNSGNPYSAAKAGGEELCVAYYNTYKMPIIITHTMNVFGERQHPEKFIQKVIRKVLAGEEVTIHGNSDKTKSGTRFWIHARNVVQAMMFIISHKDTENGDKFNIVGEREVSNLEIAQMIAKILGKELKYKITDFHDERPGHDFRYALDGGKMEKMGWKPPVGFDESFKKTIKWMAADNHKKWLYDMGEFDTIKEVA
ncbi:MAG: aminotransferase/S-adenosyl-L-homocysteine hydrolase [Candidatus Berkelbacteria bacterium Athens1014_28]|uniref:Aminotransferase/S-adenosyl-L-homocysteine hydrolase n=1 Tax=Candidatus Berkelbacteria bacterium Athens1014_28 TaxID=2017145 RepID=A0A554LPR3_9BACT|nr:MAG: aminotransferase/S-adenosyl-L-homocysteine hydrolase [Candidatus Berkelbacteria bacterium Athens1014_28]